MARHTHEFQCTECRWWNYPILSDTMSGNYVVRCGKCQHHHYRYIKKGVVTEDRHNQKENICDIIHVMPSACLQEKRKQGTVTQLREMMAAGLME